MHFKETENTTNEYEKKNENVTTYKICTALRNKQRLN